jgi:hypothetical protein
VVISVLSVLHRVGSSASEVILFFFVLDWRRCRLHLHPCPNPPRSTPKPAIISTRSARYRSSAYRLFRRPWLYPYSYVDLYTFGERLFTLAPFVDGLSIPFFSIGRHTLTMSRSLVVDQPDWVLWVRRDAPQVDTERFVDESENTNVVIPESSRRAVKIDVSNTFYPGTSPL